MKRVIKHIACLLLVSVYLSGCSTLTGNFPSSTPSSAPNSLAYSHFGVDMSNTTQVKQQLLTQLDEWKGVPHKYGGLTREGIDCSGFVYMVFAQEFGIKIPRTTEYQMQKGVIVEQDNLKPGDLVFFITGYNQRHVGIYMGKNTFMHTSSSRGVMMSKLNNPYWEDAYWHARRVAL